MTWLNIYSQEQNLKGLSTNEKMLAYILDIAAGLYLTVAPTNSQKWNYEWVEKSMNSALPADPAVFFAAPVQ